MSLFVDSLFKTIYKTSFHNINSTALFIANLNQNDNPRSLLFRFAMQKFVFSSCGLVSALKLTWFD